MNLPSAFVPVFDAQQVLRYISPLGLVRLSQVMLKPVYILTAKVLVVNDKCYIFICGRIEPVYYLKSLEAHVSAPDFRFNACL